MSFDYPYTCPKIDKCIDEAEDKISDFLSDCLQEALPLLSTETHNFLVKIWTQDLYMSLEKIFEETRSSNSEMRNAAEKQIKELENLLSQTELDVEYWKDKYESIT